MHFACIIYINISGILNCMPSCPTPAGFHTYKALQQLISGGICQCNQLPWVLAGNMQTHGSMWHIDSMCIVLHPRSFNKLPTKSQMRENKAEIPKGQVSNTGSQQQLAAGMWVEGLPLISLPQGFSLWEAKQNLAAGYSLPALILLTFV